MLIPLASLIRPGDLSEVVGQEHILSEGKPLRRIIEKGTIPNMIFYGPSGIGKTTVAEIISQRCNKTLHRLNGTQASIGDIKEIVSTLNTFSGMNGVVLYLDEIQYLNKKQQQSLLEYIEDGRITLIASTTENPYFYVYGAILSRCTIFEFRPVPAKSVENAVVRGYDKIRQLESENIIVEDGVVEYISLSCGGDVRKAINAVETSVLSGEILIDGSLKISLDAVKLLSQKSSLRYDKDADVHYDLLSAFQKSIRGSDPDAAVHYLARLLAAGDILSPCRRLLVTASEDVGLANSQAICVVKSCVDSALQLGLPEAGIPLAQATILLATSPKSNSAKLAINKAMAGIQASGSLEIPAHLKDASYSGAANLGRGLTYKYPHDFPNSYIKQDYLPNEIIGEKYYVFGNNKMEQAAKEYWQRIKKD